MTLALAAGGFAVSLAPAGAVGPPWMLALLAAASFAWVLRAPLDARRDDALPALAVLTAALGLTTIARLSSDLAHRQEAWLLLSIALAIGAGPAFDRFRRFAAYKYVWVLGSVVLFALVAIFGQEVNGAKLWIRIGPVQYEPVELIKLFIVLFMAGYLAETADVIAAARPWSIRSNLKYLGPLFVGWATSMAILVFERDIGMASLLLATFATMLYVATRRIDLIVGGATLFGCAVWLAVQHYPYVMARFSVWRDPFADPLGHGYQALQGLFSLAAGGLFGTGYGLGHPDYIPAVATDYVFAAFSEEFGALGGMLVIAAFLVLLVRALRVAQAQPDLYAKLLASGLAATLGFQVFIIIAGVLGVFPLTGITLPFFSYGGSSLVANFLLVALVWAISSERVAARTSRTSAASVRDRL
ncbi:MAG: FtsW/RodA/SpoVE family cell cycle protein [Candidatus Eremiobacteraeota bacterium]|nr:FtsW/RodA/SpoVE family cell cycle protein [Candidatus Eremiobacteraeota bacterium]